MTNFGDYDAALRTRDALSRLVLRIIDQARPPDRYGTVTEVDPDRRVAKVRYSETSEPVSVRFGALAPSGPGQVVKVGGPTSDQWITDILGVPAIVGPPTDSLPAPAVEATTYGGGSVVATWTEVVSTYAAISHYEVQFATDSVFTALLGTYRTMSTTYTLDGLTPGVRVWVRVRAIAGTSIGPWSTPASVVPTGFDTPSDGFPPEDSPTPIVEPGLGWLMAKWVHQPNADLVTYEVHASVVNSFTPTAATLVAETTATNMPIHRLPDGAALPYDMPTFVRLIAKDADGAAAAGPQGWGTPNRIELGDVGNVVGSDLTDGQPPLASPTNVQVTSGVGFLYLNWTHVGNPDAVTYEIHLSTTAGFTPTANTLVHSTPANFTFVRSLPPGLGGGPLQYQTYRLKVFARDADGYAPSASPEVTGTVTQVGSADVVPLSITNALIADAAISTAKIENAAITDAKVAQLSANKITTGTLDASKVTVVNLNASLITTGTLSADFVRGGTFDAALMNVVNLSATSITSGTMSANRIMGGTLHGAVTVGDRLTTAEGQGTRIEVTNDPWIGGRIDFYDDTNTRQGSIHGYQYMIWMGNDDAFLNRPSFSMNLRDGDVSIVAGNDAATSADFFVDAKNLNMTREHAWFKVPLISSDVRYFSNISPNHRTYFDPAIDGVRMQGYSNCAVRSVVADAEFRVQNDGNAVLYDNGQTWGMKGIPSAEHLKTDIHTIKEGGLSRLLAMRPVAFKRQYDDQRPAIESEIVYLQDLIAEDQATPDQVAQLATLQETLIALNERWENELDLAVQEYEIGFIAEEMQAVEPRIVRAATDSTPMSIMYAQLTALIVVAVKELDAALKDGANQLNAINAAITDLESRVTALEGA